MTGAVSIVSPASRAGDCGPVAWSDEVGPEDVERVRRLVAATGKFNREEIDMAAELVEMRISLGERSGYRFVLARGRGGDLLGYACFGPIEGTDARFDFYWIAVLPECQGRGLGQRLLEATEEAIWGAGGRRIYLDTSTSVPYEATRRFYDRAGYRREAVLVDFYRDGDGKLIMVKDAPDQVPGGGHPL
ncbi:MAG: GNAT family N-acetyltransferase [Magnetococcales bacterium]|nr:GNAT family N-acetyltransferase [Magnetococcales bacterium]